MTDIQYFDDRQLNNLEASATSQFVTGGELIPTPVRYHLCGLTSPYMAIKLLSLENDFSELIPTFPAYIAAAIKQTSINCNNTTLSQRINDQYIDIPVFYSSESADKVWEQSIRIVKDLGLLSEHATNEDIEKTIKFFAADKNKPRIRGFSINTGWDTEGSQQVLTNLGLAARITCSPRSKFQTGIKDLDPQTQKDTLFSELKDKLTISKKLETPIKKLATVSINTKLPGWKRYYGDYSIIHNYTKHTVQSHVVMVVGFTENNAIFLDPAGKTTNDIIQYMDINDFQDAYNGIHTLFEVIV